VSVGARHRWGGANAENPEEAAAETVALSGFPSIRTPSRNLVSLWSLSRPLGLSRAAAGASPDCDWVTIRSPDGRLQALFVPSFRHLVVVFASDAGARENPG